MTAQDTGDRPLVAVANRLPVQHTAEGWVLSPGGLVTALKPVMTQRPGAWVGWDGGAGEDDTVPTHVGGLSIDLQPVSLTDDDVAGYYHGFSNRTLWPLLHDAIEKPVYRRSWWGAYERVNRRFAEAAVAVLAQRPEALLWVQDYQLMLVPSYVRELLPDQRIGFFLHVPWPAPDLYARLPWRREVLEGLLGADVVSFHTERYRRNFVRSCERSLAPRRAEVRGKDLVLSDRVVRTTAWPISIDAQEFSQLATSAEVGEELALLRRQFAGRQILLGVDRLDYTKGIVERLLAFEDLLERRPDLRDKLVFLQIAVPSRDEVAEYRELRTNVEQLVGRINGRFTQPGAPVPVHYFYRGLSPHSLAAHYALADAMLVTPLVDGMNLVAKEYVVVQHALRQAGVLVLSEFTGAADELRDATRVNPFDVAGTSRAIESALTLPEKERRESLRTMATRVRSHDVHRWVRRELDDLALVGRQTP